MDQLSRFILNEGKSKGASMAGRFRADSSVFHTGPFLPWLLFLFVTVHLLLTLLMPDAEAKFMLGDRAEDRLAKVVKLLSANGLVQAMKTLVAEGSPGDYLFQVPAYALLGARGVMLQSLVLYAAAIICLYVGVRDVLGDPTARLAALIFTLLPATIFHPQAFVSEAITNPLLVIAAFVLWRGIRNGSEISIAAAATVIGVIAIARHVYVLLPVLAAVHIYVFSPRTLHRGRVAIAAILIGFMPMIAWAITTGLVPVEKSRASAGGLGANLQARAERIALIAGVKAPEPIVEDARAGMADATRSITLRQYVTFVATHPVAYARTVVSDCINIIANPGVAMVVGRYLGAFDLKERSEADLSRWRMIRDEHGMLAVARELWRTSPLGLIVNAAGLAIWCGLLLASLVGLYKAFRNPSISATALAMWVGLFVYTIAFSSLASGYTRWDHRSGVEFVIAIFSAYALAGRRYGRAAPSAR